jgi:UDP-N-acetylmuramate--alanine ligase
VYAAGEAPLPGGDSATLAGHLAAKGREGVSLLGGMENIPAWLDGFAAPGGLVLTLGAGDIGRQVDSVCAHLDQRGAP